MGQLREGGLATTGIMLSGLWGNSVSVAAELVSPCVVSPFYLRTFFYLISCILNNIELFASAFIFVPQRNVLAFLRLCLV